METLDATTYKVLTWSTIPPVEPVRVALVLEVVLGAAIVVTFFEVE